MSGLIEELMVGTPTKLVCTTDQSAKTHTYTCVIGEYTVIVSIEFKWDRSVMPPLEDYDLKFFKVFDVCNKELETNGIPEERKLDLGFKLKNLWTNSPEGIAVKDRLSHELGSIWNKKA